MPFDDGRDEARLFGIADVIRLLAGADSSVVTPAINLIVTRWPAAYGYVPVGSRPGEEKPKPQA